MTLPKKQSGACPSESGWASELELREIRRYASQINSNHTGRLAKWSLVQQRDGRRRSEVETLLTLHCDGNVERPTTLTVNITLFIITTLFRLVFLTNTIYCCKPGITCLENAFWQICKREGKPSKVQVTPTSDAFTSRQSAVQWNLCEFWPAHSQFKFQKVQLSVLTSRLLACPSVPLGC